MSKGIFDQKLLICSFADVDSYVHQNLRGYFMLDLFGHTRVCPQNLQMCVTLS